MNLDPIAQKVKSFYEQTPFPNYDDFDDIQSLQKKAEKSLFARMLNQQIPTNARVIEIGCGTGQLTNYLSICGRKVTGIDITENSLKLARDFGQKFNLSSEFMNMDLFQLTLPEKSFDFVICNGVLHHTKNSHEGFKAISKLVKPEGYVLVGLYNTYGRLLTNARQLVFRLTGGKWKEALDSHLADPSMNEGRKQAWFRDQYQHPCERKHTFGEVLRWFDEDGFDFMSGIPATSLSDSFGEGTRLFQAHSRGSVVEHAVIQLHLILRGAREGGFFIFIGKKRRG